MTENVSMQLRLHKSLRLWCFYVELEEKFGTLEGTRAVYEKILDLKIAIPKIILNYALFLEYVSLVNPSLSVDCTIIGDSYESFAIYCFGRYLVACLVIALAYQLKKRQSLLDIFISTKLGLLLVGRHFFHWRCMIYKSIAEEVSVWGSPLPTSGLLSTGFSSRSLTLLSSRITEWSDGKLGSTSRARNGSSWTQQRWMTVVGF